MKSCASARRLPQRGRLALQRRKSQPSTMGRALAARAHSTAAEAASMTLKSTGSYQWSHNTLYRWQPRIHACFEFTPRGRRGPVSPLEPPRRRRERAVMVRGEYTHAAKAQKAADLEEYYTMVRRARDALQHRTMAQRSNALAHPQSVTELAVT